TRIVIWRRGGQRRPRGAQPKAGALTDDPSSAFPGCAARATNRGHPRIEEANACRSSHAECGPCARILRSPAQSRLRDRGRHGDRIIGHDGETCSGTIIGPRKIVTAAHCFESTDPRNYRVVTLDPHFAPREMPVAAIVTHPHFDRTAIDGSRVINDIALVYT